MGMHFGILAARCPLSQLEPVLSGFGSFTPFEPADAQPDDALIGEYGGQSFMQEALCELTAHGDFIVQLSERLGTLVIGCGAETTSGSAWLFAAEAGRLWRAHWACDMELSEPYDTGDWGRDVALDDLDGEGLTTLLRRAGFEYDAFLENFSVRRFETLPTLELPDGPVMRNIEAHRSAHRLPEQRVPQLVLRSAPAPQAPPHSEPIRKASFPWVVVLVVIFAGLGLLSKLLAP